MNDIQDQLKTALQLAECLQPLSVQKRSVFDVVRQTVAGFFKTASKTSRTHSHQRQTVKVKQGDLPVLEIEIENSSLEETHSQETEQVSG